MARTKKTTLTDVERFCLSGYISTGDSVTAYRLAFNSTSDDILNLQKMASRWLNRPECQEYIENRRSADFKAAKQSLTNENGETSYRTRTDAEGELNAIISSTDDPRIKADAIMKLADLNRWKKTEEIPDEKRVVFYVPLRNDDYREIFAYKLKLAFGWTEEQQKEAVRIMESVMNQ